jgi:hypothetical protein
MPSANPIQTAEGIVTLPFKIANGIVKPYSQAIQQGRYGEAVGRLAVDVTVIAASFNGSKPPGNPPGPAPTPTPTPPPVPPTPAVTPVPVADVLDDVGKVAGGSAANNVTSQVGDVLIEKLVNVENVAAGATVNINIGNIEIGKTVMSGTMHAGSSGGGGALKSVGKMMQNADEVAQVVTPQTMVEMAQAVDNVAPALTSAEVVTVAAEQSRTVGQLIGGGIDKVIAAPSKVFNGIASGFHKIGDGFDKIGKIILNPLDSLKGLNPVQTAEWIGNGPAQRRRPDRQRLGLCRPEPQTGTHCCRGSGTCRQSRRRRINGIRFGALETPLFLASSTPHKARFTHRAFGQKKCFQEQRLCRLDPKHHRHQSRPKASSRLATMTKAPLIWPTRSPSTANKPSKPKPKPWRMPKPIPAPKWSWKRVQPGKGLGFDVYQVTIHGQRPKNWAL